MWKRFLKAMERSGMARAEREIKRCGFIFKDGEWHRWGDKL